MDDRRRDGGTNFILRIKEQGTRLTINEHDDDDDDDVELFSSENLAVCDIKWKKYYSTVQATDDSTAHAHCILDN